ncbi:hypothetical protein ABZ714_23800 [Streptomyces sp. NPDC006798]|uniref:hypothetical protein n=1 Tax=Streptomyces sp. NPDC006798 TaxID=3155462 RepID=UPI0033DBF4D3
MTPISSTTPHAPGSRPAAPGGAFRRARRRTAAVPALVTLLLAAATGCGDGGGGDDRAGRVRTTASSTPAPEPSGVRPSPTGPATASPPTGSPGSTGSPSPGGSRTPGPTGTTSGPDPTDGGTTPPPTPRPTTPPPPPVKPPSADRLARALFPTAGLPAGYVRTVLPSHPPNRSSRPDCVQRLNALELHRTTHPGAVETRAAWARSRSGPFLQQVLRWYPGRAASAQVSTAARELSGCGTYELAWPDGDTARQTVTPLGGAGIGDTSWHAAITVRYAAATVEETMVLVAVRGCLIVLSHLGSPAAPARAQTLGLARTAADRLPDCRT